MNWISYPIQLYWALLNCVIKSNDNFCSFTLGYILTKEGDTWNQASNKPCWWYSFPYRYTSILLERKDECNLAPSLTVTARLCWDFRPFQGLFSRLSCRLRKGSLPKWKWSRSVVSDSLRPHELVAYQAPPSMGFSRQEYWSGLPFPSPGDLPDPGI